MRRRLRSSNNKKPEGIAFGVNSSLAYGLNEGNSREAANAPVRAEPNLPRAFFHPDCTVGSGVSPDHAKRLLCFARGLYHRSGIGVQTPHPAPKDLALSWLV